MCLDFQTAGIGVFAGRAFKKYEIVLRSWMTLLLPQSFPQHEMLRCYVFGRSKTDMALDLDYGSIINHHESANAVAAAVKSADARAGGYMHYRVCGLSMFKLQCKKKLCMHAYIMYAHIHNTYTCT